MQRAIVLAWYISMIVFAGISVQTVFGSTIAELKPMTIENNTKYVSWRCENELKNNQTTNFEESKYPLSAQSAANARIMDECLPAGSATPLGYNATMPPSLYRLLENKGCFEGIEKADIKKITAHDILRIGCW